MSVSINKIYKRDGSLVAFDLSWIVRAVSKAMTASKEGSRASAQLIAKQVYAELERKARRNKRFISKVEGVQDLVEQALILNQFTKTAKAYILYRQKRHEMRQREVKVSDKVKKLVSDSKRYFRNPLSEVVYLRTYARWLDEENRRETWIETVDRYMAFMQDHMGDQFTAHEYKTMHQAILNQEVMPSMRLMQFAGPAVKKTNVCAYNCSYIAPNTLQDFGEIMYICMCGCGVGFSVESQNIQMLPVIKKQTGQLLKTHQVGDSREGWCDAFVLGLKTWFQGQDICFNYSKLRPQGVRIKTLGGKSSGPDPLQALLDFARSKILAKQGRRLANIDAYDILCKIGEVVVSGGVRRSAMISLSDLDDRAMCDAKSGQFYYSEPQRAFSNNSAVYEDQPHDEVLMEEWLALIKSGSGERGLFNRGSLIETLTKRRKDYFIRKGVIVGDKITGLLGTNPCGEIILQSKQFCNLTEVVARPEDNEKSLLKKIRIAAMLGSYQATLTHFPYLSKDWKKNCEQERLLGVSITGQWDCKAARHPSVLKKLKNQAIRTNRIYAKRLGIHPATAVTCVKPSGTVSLVVDSAAGMHPRYAPYYIRRVRISAMDGLFKMLKAQGVPYHPEVGHSAEDAVTFVLDFIVAAPKAAVYRNDLTAIDQLEYWKMLKTHYTEHNPSVTISVGQEEWIGVLNWLREHWEIIGGLSFLPRFEDVYQLAPFEEITKTEYQTLQKRYKKIDFTALGGYE